MPTGNSSNNNNSNSSSSSSRNQPQPLTPGLLLKKLVLHGQSFLVYPAGFLPRPRSVRKPDASYQDIQIRTSDHILLRCFLIEPPRTHMHTQPRGIVLMFHGNGMDMSYFSYHARCFKRSGLSVLTVSYRGFGESEGVPSEKGLQRDAQAALDYITNDERLSKLPIIVYGLSLGGAVAIDVTSRNPHKITALILENTFTSIPNIVRSWPIIGRLSFACTQRWNSASKLPKIPPTLPILFCSGRKDGVVPPEHMDNLWRIARERSSGTGGGGGGRGRKVGFGLSGLGLLCTAKGSFEEVEGTGEGGGGGGGGLDVISALEGDHCQVEPVDDCFRSYSRGGHVDTCLQSGYWSEMEKFIHKSIALRK